MSKLQARFVSILLVGLGIIAAYELISLPLHEGRASNLDLISIYTDPFILYFYAISIPFFVLLVNAYRIIQITHTPSSNASSHKAWKKIAKAAGIISIGILGAGLYIRFFHHPNDDPAGFIVLCFVNCILFAIISGVAFRKYQGAKNK